MDNGTPTLQTYAEVIVNIKDLNDNLPQFQREKYMYVC